MAYVRSVRATVSRRRAVRARVGVLEDVPGAAGYPDSGHGDGATCEWTNRDEQAFFWSAIAPHRRQLGLSHKQRILVVVCIATRIKCLGGLRSQ